MALTLEDLIKPVSDEDPCGEDVEYDPLFVEMETMFESTPEQEYGDTIIAGSGPDWMGVRDNALALLERSRDLRALVYGALASMHTDGSDKPKTLETPNSAAECTTEHADAARQRMMKRNRDASSGAIANSKTLADVQSR